MKKFLLITLFTIVVILCGVYMFSELDSQKSGSTNFRKPPSSASSMHPSVSVTAKRTFLTPTNLSAYARGILENWAEMPDLGRIGQLTPEEKKMFVEAYRQEPVLVKRRALIYALGFAGVEEAVELFKHTLTDEFKGQKITAGTTKETDALSVMYITMEMLGPLAKKYDSAFEFLQQGSDPLFWREKALWVRDLESDQYGIMAGDSIVSLGMSGRAEVAQLLDKLKGESLVNTADESKFARRLDGAVMEAAFWYDMTQKGDENLKAAWGKDVMRQFYQEWLQTENGKQWDLWYKQRLSSRAAK